jgi:hypothetical protein
VGAVPTLMAPNIAPLESLNNNDRFDLHEPLTLTLSNNAESNHYIDNPISTTYHDLETLPNFMSGTNKCVFASLNIHSLMSNFNHFSSIINNLTLSNVNIAIIALQEVWSVPYPNLVQIPGFKLILNTRTKARGGGVGY